MQSKSSKIRRVDVVETLNGIDIRDPYRWLEKNDDVEVQQWIEQQNRATRLALDAIPKRHVIRDRLNHLFRTYAVGVPEPKGNRYFFRERNGADDLSVLYVQDGLSGSPRTLIDPNTFSEDRSADLHGWYPSNDGKLVAYGLSEAANDQASIHILNVETGEKLSDIIPSEIYPSPHSGIAWNLNGDGFWYTHRDPHAPKGEEKFHQKLYYHKLGRDFKDDPMVFGETIAKEDIPCAEISRDGRYLLVTISKSSGEVESTALYLYDFEGETKGFVAIIDGVDAVFSGKMHRGRLYIQTNYNAPLWKLLCVDIDAVRNGVNVDQFDVIIPQGEHKLESFALIKDNLFVETQENVHSVFRRYGLDGKLVSEVPLPALGSLTALGGEDEGEEFFFGFTSFVVSHNIYRFDFANEHTDLFRKAEDGIDASAFVVDQIWYASKDGTRIPMFLIHKKGMKRNGNNPVVLYGYGGFNISITPGFDESKIPFLESGGIYAVANIRGGGEFGEAWHKAGTRKNKQNVFDDFIAAAEWLIAEKYTTADRLAIFGWSNGGLLTATVATQRPELFKAVVIGAPVIDMARYHLFFGGRHWIPDYGCVEDYDMIQYLLAYSPYHNVRGGAHYPATLIVTADKDDRVHPMHAYKMTAQLQEANASLSPILLRVEINSGHACAPGVSRSADLYADIWAFIFNQLGME